MNWRTLSHFLGHFEWILVLGFATQEREEESISSPKVAGRSVGLEKMDFRSCLWHLRLQQDSKQQPATMRKESPSLHVNSIGKPRRLLLPLTDSSSESMD